MQEYIQKRVLEISNYIIESKSTVRQTAGVFGVSKSTLHKDITERLPLLNEVVAGQVKEILENNGVAAGQSGSPRQILKAAYQAGMIKDEQLWLSALVARNNVSHAYNQAIALEIVRQTRETYYQMFQSLKSEIDQNWL